MLLLLYKNKISSHLPLKRDDCWCEYQLRSYLPFYYITCDTFYKKRQITFKKRLQWKYITLNYYRVYVFICFTWNNFRLFQDEKLKESERLDAWCENRKLCFYGDIVVLMPINCFVFVKNSSTKRYPAKHNTTQIKRKTLLSPKFFGI